MRKLKSNNAFTLIELLVVIAVLAVLVLLAVPKFLDYTNDAKLAQIKNDVKVYESTIEKELINDDDFFTENNWKVVSSDELENYKNSGGLFSKKGLVSADEVFNDEYFLGEDLINSKLKGEFIVAKGGKTYYLDESIQEGLSTKSIDIKFDRQPERSQIHTFTIPRLTKIESITADNGDVEIIKIDGNKVTVRVTNGELKNDVETIKFTTNFKEEAERIFANDYKIDTKTVPAEFEQKDWNITREYTGSPIKYYNDNYFIAHPDNHNYSLRFNAKNDSWDYTSSGSASGNLVIYKDGEYSTNWRNIYGDVFNSKLFAEVKGNVEKGVLDKFGDLIINNGSLPGHTDLVIRRSGEVIDEMRLNEVVDLPPAGFGITVSTSSFNSDIRNFIDKNKLQDGDTMYIRRYEISHNLDYIMFKGGDENAEWTYTGTHTGDDYYKYGITVNYK